MNVYRRSLHATLSMAALAVASSATPVFAQTSPTNLETFLTKWVPTNNPQSFGEPNDLLFKIDGNYCVPYGGAQPVCLEIGNVNFQPAPLAKWHKQMTITVPAHVYQGGEVATGAGWEPDGPTPPFGPSKFGYGYYETRMKPSCVQGEVSSFFWVQAPSYGPLEYDVEFPNPPGHTFTDVHWTIHPSNQTVDYQLGFNPCTGFHKYGFLWTPGKMVFTVDGQAKYTMTDPTLVNTETGFIMANAWDGNPNWGGGPPAQTAVNTYDWMTFYANATTIPTASLNPNATSHAAN